MRRIFAVLAAAAQVLSALAPAYATTAITVTAPSTLTYNPAANALTLSDVSISASVAYVQVELSLVTQAGMPVDANDDYRIAVGTQCTFESQWTNSSSGGSVTLSGDNSTNVLLLGSPDDVTAALAHVWMYRQASNFCGGSGTSVLGGAALSRSINISVVETSPGVYYSTATGHYYSLVTNTSDDGMGQPTDSSGNVTDSSRYFVRWSTARSLAKASSIQVAGSSHRGYLAAITTKAEFQFLNNNVSGGSGVLYPAWVGGSDQDTEGRWRWVDGPEAAQFGGDTLTHSVTTYTDPEQRTLMFDDYGTPYLQFGTNTAWGQGYALFMRDQDGNFVTDPDTGYRVVVNTDWNGSYCREMQNDYWGYWYAFYYQGYVEVNQTPYGSSVVCDIGESWIYVQDQLGNQYYQTLSGSNTDAIIYHLDQSGYSSLDANSDWLAVQVGSADFSYSTGIAPNYQGAIFWGLDSGAAPSDGNLDYCTNRGVRGTCQQTQLDVSGNWQTNPYFVYWSNGDRGNYADWDGIAPKPGDGVYAPQPDNAFLNGSPSGENALVINWCARNASDFSNSDAVTQSLYGNSGYRCTPGWNDLAAGDWAGASNSYPNSYLYDTPNQIGTTDFVVEYCGYTDESSCTPAATQARAITLTAPSTCGTSSDSNLTATFEAAQVETTSLSSPTMAVLDFDSIPAGWVASPTHTNVGTLTGAAYSAPPNAYGAAGGIGHYGSMNDAVLTLPQKSCYVGFWWSAGNADNNVQFLDENDQVVASFNAGNLVSNLGQCTGSNPYCGHPDLGFANGGELYAFVNLRLPIGFSKLRFFGQGFELDNITTSVNIPSRSGTETAVTTQSITTSCSNVTASQALANLVACPRGISITVGQTSEYDPRLESQIAGYSYPNGTALQSTYVYSGAGSATLSSHGGSLAISSDSVGTFYVDFVLQLGASTAASRITVTVVAASAATLIAPDVLLIDPRATSIRLGSVVLDGSPTVSVCARPVADAQGTPVNGSAAFGFNAGVSPTLATAATFTEFYVLAGSMQNVTADSASMTVSKASGRLTSSGSVFIQVSVFAGVATTRTDCINSTSHVVEIRPIDLDLRQQLILNL